MKILLYLFAWLLVWSASAQNMTVTLYRGDPANNIAYQVVADWSALTNAGWILAKASTADVTDATNKVVSSLGSAAFTSSILYDAAGAARNATNGLGAVAFMGSTSFVTNGGNASALTNAIVAKSANYTLTSSDWLVLMNGNLSATLPTAVGIPGRSFVVKCVTSGTNAVLLQSGQTVDGFAKYTNSANGKFVHLISDGANYRIIGSN